MTNLYQANPKLPKEEDEISLSDILKVLWRNRKLMLIVFIICLIFGTAYTLLQSNRYEYSTTIEIGYIPNDNVDSKLVLIESPTMLKAKILESYIPNAIYRQVQQSFDRPTEPKVSIPKGSDLIVIKSIGKEVEKKAHLKLLNEINHIIIEDHKAKIALPRDGIKSKLVKAKILFSELKDPSTSKAEESSIALKLSETQITIDDLSDKKILSLSKKKLEAQKQKIESNLMSLQDEIKMNKKKKLRLNDTENLLIKQAKESEALLNDSQEQRRSAIKEVINTPQAMTMLLLDNEIQRRQQTLADLKERLIEIKNQKDQITTKLNQLARGINIEKKRIVTIQNKMEKITIDNSRAKARQLAQLKQLNTELEMLQNNHQRNIHRQQENIRSLESKLDALTGSKILSPPMQSLSPVSPNRKLILLLTMLLGVLLACFSAFIRELITNIAKESKMEEAETQKIAA